MKARASLDQRRVLHGLAVGTIALLIASTAAFLWRDRQQALQESGEHATRRVMRLSQDLEHTLKVARTAIARFDEQLQKASTAPFQAQPFFPAETNATLLASLPLPFELHALAAKGYSLPLVGIENAATHSRSIQIHADGPPLPGVWTLGHVEQLVGQQIIPLAWAAQPNLQQITGYGVDLSFAAVQSWLERDRKSDLDRVSLFWLNGDGTATLLARSPAAPQALGQRVTADWIPLAMHQPTGVLDLESPLDQRPRRVAYGRLQGGAASMVVVYGADTETTLAPWRAQLPYFILLALFFSAAMAYGTWRLDRSLRALTQSKQHFQLMLDSGNVWDWDIGQQTLRYSPLFFAALGFDALPSERMASSFFKAVHPDDLGPLKADLMAHLKQRKPYALAFRIRDGQGQIRWFETKGQAFWDHHGRAQYMAGTTFEITERIALEEVQRQTLQRLDTVANASAVMFWTSDLQGQVNWVNRRWLAFTGRRLEDELAQGWLDNLHPDDLARNEAFFERVKTTQAAQSEECRFRDKNGDFRWFVTQSRPLRDADQRVTGFIGSCVDITELKQAEDEVRQRGAMLERVFDVLQDMLFVVDAQGRFVHYQGAADARLYAPAELFLGRTVDEVMPGALAELLKREMAQAEHGQLRDFDYNLDLPDGHHRFNARLARLPESDQTMVVARDITERETLKEERGRLEQFLILQLGLASRFINHPLDTIDTEIHRALGEIGAFVQADRAYIFLYDLPAHTASNSHEWCAPGIAPAIAQLQNLSMSLIPDWVAAHSQQQAFVVEDVQALAQGSLRDILEPQAIRSLIALPMHSSQSLLGFVGFDSVRGPHTYDREEVGLLQLFAQMLVNVQERRKAEARWHALAADLEIRVQDRTRQLDASVKRLSQANQELESFAYSVSHDLKAPLRSVEGFASLLLEEHSASLNSEGRDHLARIQGASLHMARLISDLLTYCRMEELDKSIVPVRLLGVVNDVLGGMRNELEAQGVRLRLQVPSDLTVLAHPQGLAMVLRNLVDNAIKFTCPGTAPDITLTAAAQGAVTRLCVQDQGQGFDMKYHDRIFAIFQRLHRPEAIPGTGIGLAMVFKAVQRMNGRIWADSQPGQGAKFHIELPSA